MIAIGGKRFKRINLITLKHFLTAQVFLTNCTSNCFLNTNMAVEGGFQSNLICGWIAVNSERLRCTTPCFCRTHSPVSVYRSRWAFQLSAAFSIYSRLLPNRINSVFNHTYIKPLIAIEGCETKWEKLIISNPRDNGVLSTENRKRWWMCNQVLFITQIIRFAILF